MAKHHAEDTMLLAKGVSSDDVQSVSDKYVAMHGGDDKLGERKEYHTDLANMYYDLVTDFYEYGWGSSFHFAPRHLYEGFHASIARHEHYLAMKMKMEKDHKILDVGCGVGGPAREIARFSEAHVTGLNNNAYQIKRANARTVQEDLVGRVDFVKGNFMQIPFEGMFFFFLLFIIIIIIIIIIIVFFFNLFIFFCYGFILILIIFFSYLLFSQTNTSMVSTKLRPPPTPRTRLSATRSSSVSSSPEDTSVLTSGV